jgi:Cu(I)/Ag(I) efflux system membrane fusion protein
MNELETSRTPDSPAGDGAHSQPTLPPAPGQERGEPLRWWLKLLLQPLLFLLAGVIVIVGLGIAQRQGWISSGSIGIPQQTAVAGEQVRYTCPMMCTPPLSAPGRCPVCAMELVPVTKASGSSDPRSIQIEAVARRVANIHTVAVRAVPWTRTIRAIGELSYDEGTLKTIAAYVDGRLDRLFADYTGVVVRKGDHLALVYSPVLYTSQVELLLAKRSRQESQARTRDGASPLTSDLYTSAKERLIELGMTQQQLAQLEQKGVANSRLYLCAPISGTVIEKNAVEGQYVKEGQAIYKLADLSTVWLMLKLFPEDAAAIHYGQTVNAEVQSLPGRTFTGRVAFVDPMVDRKTRTVGVRIVIKNPDGLLRVGDYARATIEVPLSGSGEARGKIYDPQLAHKWISPRHPHIIESAPGKCRICGVNLVPASRFGFTDEPTAVNKATVVPRNAVLMAGDHSVVYVETKPGRFEIRPVVLGPSSGNQIVILKGVREGERVASSGNFLIDSQMQLAGHPSLIDPLKAGPLGDDPSRALAKLSPEDRALAKKQRTCPVADTLLGSMGPPRKVEVKGKSVFICCERCRKSLLKEPEKYLAKLASKRKADQEARETPQMALPAIAAPQIASPESPSSAGETPGADSGEAKEIAEALSQLSSADQRLAKRQKVCPVTGMPLGAMGVPIKVEVRGTPVFLCCEGCRARLLAAPEKYLPRIPQGEEQ